mmetsp:Transcript_2150/g.5024  ORF Transcript_2150/g.5024 Transcript_2150/m.5024 type:complete len:117 (+) Transcript_2150:221-571(+)|eukprot:CAMPEP_0179000142 /NCGR_PEP_ID=MMETSP0795-20121207/10490_1 /TAXON_ID=88552 /ORGANISM="Amoebophrya sp., Strain Ameob2" /LENGTH=116 /DNA_ID=CAMNT_0020693071 /DNA_START=208 /DNA_END=558 /DNA_ORIENTATION=+
MGPAVFAALAAGARTYAKKRQAMREGRDGLGPSAYPPTKRRELLAVDVSDLTNRPCCCFFAICCCFALFGRSADLRKGGRSENLIPEEEAYRREVAAADFDEDVDYDDPDLRGAFS